MRIGVFSVLFKQLKFIDAIEKIKSFGATAVEIGTGGYAGGDHCPIDDLLSSEHSRQEYIDIVRSRGMIISAFSCHYEPLHPDPQLRKQSDEIFRKSVRLASLLGVPVVNVFSGVPAGAPGDTSPNWITCPWPKHYQEMLDYQWNEVAIPYWTKAGKFAEEHGVKIAVEIHPGMLIYNVETLLRMRKAVGEVLGANFDPSHLFWNGVDPVAAIRELGPAIHHVHGKDCYIDPYNTAVNGCNDNKPYDRILDRSWTFRSIGYGHDVKVWKDIVSTLRLVGYDYVISIEHEDPMMSINEGLGKSISVIKEAIIYENPGEMYWI